MADTTFIDRVTPILSSWLNTINDMVYHWQASFSNAIARTLSSKLEDIVSVKDFGATGDGITVDTDAIQNAIDSLGPNGGTVYFPPGTYLIDDTITITTRDTILMGSGVSSNHNTGAGSTEGSCQLVGNNTTGPMLIFSSYGGELRDITITGSTTRWAATNQAADGCGVLFEAADTSTGTSARSKLINVHILKQPGDGAVFIGDIVNSSATNVDIDNLKGYGIVIDGGTYTGRTNVSRPGQIDLNSVRISRTGGCALKVGNPATDVAERPYRVTGRMIECFYNRTDSSYAAYTWYIHGENIRFVDCATGGETSAGVGDHVGMYLNGLNITVSNHRYIDCETYCAYIDDNGTDSLVSKNIRILDCYINNDNHGAGYYDPAFFVVSTVRNAFVRYHAAGSGVTTLMSSASTNGEREQAGVKEFLGQTLGAFKTIDDGLSLNDDQAGYITFNAAARGLVLVSGNTSARLSEIVAFRCGDGSAYTTKLDSGFALAVASGTAGTLAGTTGTDTNFTVRADSATNRLYFENRTGGAGVYQITILSCNTHVLSSTVI